MREPRLRFRIRGVLPDEINDGRGIIEPVRMMQPARQIFEAARVVLRILVDDAKRLRTARRVEKVVSSDSVARNRQHHVAYGNLL